MARFRFVRRASSAAPLCLLLASILWLVTATRAEAATQTRTVAATLTDAGASWDNDASAGTIDNACAQANGGGGGTGFSPIDLTNWGFSLPVGATITGIEVVTDSGWNDAATADSVRLLTAPGSPAGAAKAVDGGGASASCGGAVQLTHGAANDLWGAAWSVAQVNAVGFGVRYDQDFANSALDGMTVTVHYTDPPPCVAVTGTVAATLTDAGNSWDNDANAGTIDNACAQANGGGGGTGFSPIDLTGWGFAVPVGATITGIEVVTDSGWNDAATADSVRLLTAPGSPAGAAKPVDGGGASASCGGAVQLTHGAANDLWGAAWSVAQVNAAGFGVRYDQDFANSALDGVAVTVHYCTAAPDLGVAKSNDSGGATPLGASWTWRLDVANAGSAAAAFLAGQTILTDTLPAGPAYGAATVGSVVNVTNSGNLACGIVADVLTCTASGATVTLGATTGAFRVSVVATPAATGTFTNGAAACSVDPAGAVAELDENDNACNADGITVTAPDLTAVKSHDVASPIPPGAPWNWRLDVANGGGAPAAFLAGQTILSDALPAGPAYAAPTVGNVVNVTNSGNIACGVAANVLTCTASGATVTVGATTGAFRVSLSASAATDGPFVNPSGGGCAVDPGGAVVESNEANNGCGPDGLVVAAPVAVSLLFDPAAAAPGDSISELEISLSNPNGVIAADDLVMALAMPVGLELETTAIVANSCGATLADANPDTLAIAGTLDLAPGASCAIRVPVSAAAEGDFPVATGPVTSSTVPPAASAGATLRVALPLTATKAFDPALLPANGVTRLLVTITNPSALFAATGVGFSDPLPAGLRVALPPDATNGCGGSFAPAAGDTVVTLTGGTLAPGASCDLGVDLFVAADAGGSLLNVADPVSAEGFPPGNAAEATLAVEPALAVPALDALGLAALALALAGLGLRRTARRRRLGGG